MRVLVYNVHGFRAGFPAVADAVGDVRPDIALINECGSRRRLRRFAKSLGMHALHTPLPWLRRAARNAILVREPWEVISSAAMDLDPQTKRAYPRRLLVAQLRSGDDRVTAACVHLGLIPGERRTHAARILRILRDTAGSIVLGGDLNERSNQDAATAFGEQYWDAWIRVGLSTGETYPAGSPEARIDYLFTSEDLVAERALVLGNRAAQSASDHLPVVVDLRNR